MFPNIQAEIQKLEDLVREGMSNPELKPKTKEELARLKNDAASILENLTHRMREQEKNAAKEVAKLTRKAERHLD